MPNLIVTAEVNSMIRSRARGDSFRDTATRLPNGDYSIPVDAEVFERINEIRFAGETHSDCLIRLFAFEDGKKAN